MEDEGIALGLALAKYASKSETFGRVVSKTIRSAKAKGRKAWADTGRVGKDVVKGFGGNKGQQETGSRVAKGVLAAGGLYGGHKALGAVNRFRDRHNFRGGGNGVYIDQSGY